MAKNKSKIEDKIAKRKRREKVSANIYSVWVYDFKSFPFFWFIPKTGSVFSFKYKDKFQKKIATKAVSDKTLEWLHKRRKKKWSKENRDYFFYLKMRKFHALLVFYIFIGGALCEWSIKMLNI